MGMCAVRRTAILHVIPIAGATALLLSTAAAAAKTVEQVVQVPAEAADANGRVERRPIAVTIFRDAERARAPFLVLNHGRSRKAEERAKVGRARFSDNARYLVERGFAVFVPTRIGYGVTGGPDIEDSGDCKSKRYAPVYEAAAQQTLAVIAFAKAQRYVDPARGVVMGQSFGGTTAIALAAKGTEGVVAAVNFAGGGGGNPDDRPENPCRDDRLTALFAGYGKSARIPTLWLYSENDRYFGIQKPRAWFAAFRAKGGAGTFVTLPPVGDNGHGSFTSNPAAWRPAFEAFLREIAR